MSSLLTYIRSVAIGVASVVFSYGQIDPPTFAPDLPLLAHDEDLQQNIEIVIERLYDDKIPSRPSATSLQRAIRDYEKLNISVSSGVVTGTFASSNSRVYDEADFLKTFAAELRFNPSNTEVRNYARNTLRLYGQKLQDGDLPFGQNAYGTRGFLRNAVLLGGN